MLVVVRLDVVVKVVRAVVFRYDSDVVTDRHLSFYTQSSILVTKKVGEKTVLRRQRDWQHRALKRSFYD